MTRLCAAMVVAVLAMMPASIGAQAQTAPPPSATIDAPRMLRAAARLYGLDPELLEAIAMVESGNDALAVSPRGAQGLMQLMPATALRFGVADPFDPVDNTLG
ncbi:MAG TPA: transglycosylase SLT domain-containing protein, partial [Candidatus Binataceae bacterium]|nr:transglycosylase SLT domain-containing protein [Candidatus Binataceae bacterium]